MTAISPTVYTGPFTGNGSTTAFVGDFTVADASEIEVQVNGVAVSSSLYSVALSADGVPTVTFYTAPIAAASVLLVSAPSWTQETEFANEGAYKLSAVNQINKRGAIRSNWLRRMLDRAILLPIGTAGAILPASGRTGKTISFDDAGAPILVDMEAARAIASQAEAEAGANSTKLMTPERVKQAVTVGVQFAKDRIPTFEDFGAIGNGVANDGPAIRTALASSSIVAGQAGKIYLISDNLPLLIRSHHTILGLGGPIETTTDVARPAGFKFWFTGTGTACFANNDPTSLLSHGTFRDFSIVAGSGYSKIFDMRNCVRMHWCDVWMEARGNSTAGLYSTKSDPSNASWENKVTNCHIRLPDASTAYAFDHDWSDAPIVGSAFTGGKGTLDRGYGARYTSCQFERSSNAGLTIKKLTDTKGGSAVGCAFDANKLYGVLYDVSADPTTNYDLGFQLVGNTFRTCDPNSEATPGTAQVGYVNGTGHVYTAVAQRGSAFLFPPNPYEGMTNSEWSVLNVTFGKTILGRSGGTLIDANGGFHPGATTAIIQSGTGSPEGLVDGSNSSVWLRIDGTVGQQWYMKRSSLGTLTGWVAVL